MAIQDIKNNIIGYIDQINTLDFSKLYIESVSIVEWNKMSQTEIKSYTENILVILKNLKENINVLDSVPTHHLNDLSSYLKQVINTYNSSLLDLAPNQISSQHHGVLDNLNNIYDKLRSTDLYVELKLAKNFDETILKLEEANKQLKVFKPEAFTKASNLVDDLINKKVSFEDQTIKQNLGTFLNRAVEHKIYQKENFWTFKFAGQRGWLFCAVLMASIVVTIVYSFIKVIESDGGNISLGEAVLRISSLIIPSYFMIFFLNQFNYHKRMYEIYSFKNTSLNIMGDLMRTNTDKSDDILKRGLDVLFSEPDPNLSKKYDKQLITDLVGIAKSQLNK